MSFIYRIAALIVVLTISSSASIQCQPLTPHPVQLLHGKSATLNLPAGFTVQVVAQGFKRLRFLTMSPDHRIFATDMHDLGDNSLGTIYILDGWNARTARFSNVTTYLQHLRNPNVVAFYTEPGNSGQPGQSWIYVPLTDKLLRYRFNAGDNAPNSPPEVLANYPDYGLNYKYGGWHLTRTVAFGNLHGQTRLYVTVGSSCDACSEKEEVRATLTVMDPDGSHQQILAKGLRNAVAMKYVSSIDSGALFATNMGADHLGNGSPEDTFFELDSNSHPIASGANYGWPTCYFENGTPHADQLIAAPKPSDHVIPAPPAGPVPSQFDCATIPSAYTTFAAHSSPLGVDYFPLDDGALKDTFLVALHGASHVEIGTGYRVVRLSPDSRKPEDFMTGFLQHGKVKGRPCGILRIAKDSFLLTDDLNGVIFYVHPK